MTPRLTHLMAGACVLTGAASLVAVGLGAADDRLEIALALNSAAMLGLVLSVRWEERDA